ncbi:excinuclease ABC subunit UvrA [Candidatus Peribacteria bacterium]|nr:excinuclease ABC subunit UvrA [Candidatus Peribacteria bacterium]
MSNAHIAVRGARMHNLQNIDVDIPRDQLTVVTGVSGSGKSSLAFDTIYAEGQRRYVESLSTYARQFLQLQQKTEVDSIDGLSPAISIDQKTAPRNPRSTVGTVTEMYDYLRLLFAKVGIPVNPENGRELISQSPQDILDAIDYWDDGEKYMVLAPLVRGKKGEHKHLIERAQKAGFVRLRVDGELRIITEDIELNPKQKHTIEVVVDRLVKAPYAKQTETLSDGQVIEKPNDERMRVLDSIETALRFGDGIMLLHRLSDGTDHLFSELLSDPDTGFSFPPLEPRLFSFNSPHGCCPQCHGLGYRLEVDIESAINPNLSIREGGILPWGSLGTNVLRWYQSVLQAVGEVYGFSIDEPISKIKPEVLQRLFDGFGEEEFSVSLRGQFRGKVTKTTFPGISQQTEQRYNESDSDYMRKKLEQFMQEQQCAVCDGTRLNDYARSVYLPPDLSKKQHKDLRAEGINLPSVVRMSVPDCKAWVERLNPTPANERILNPIKKELIERLGFLENVGLGYLTLSRTANTLSGGEAQRIRLATQIGSHLQGVLYVLDEPSIGLHQRDNQRLITTLHHLRDLGNTVIVVEHDEDTMRSADYLIEIGPKSGQYGGQLVYSGTLEAMEQSHTETADYLFGRKKIAVPKTRRKPVGQLKIRGATENNLQDVDVDIPLGVLVGVTGVSGSGKSSLINRILVPTLANELNRASRPVGKHTKITGVEQLDKLISIDQSAIGRTPRSNPATYTKIFDDIRTIFAGTSDARVRGYQAGRFSFNVKGGRCESCKGDGLKKIEMHFLPDVYVPCETCNGKRYNSETLEILYRGLSIYDVLELSIDEAVKFFEHLPKLHEKLEMMQDVGLGYITLGQSATTLSGGEAQRVKLANQLIRKATGQTMYILDEPTTGLHFSDVAKLLKVLQRLVDMGNSVLVIEHNLDVIKCCDSLIDLGPEGGSGGGHVVATGTPEQVASVEGSYTGQFLKGMLG